MNPAQQELFDLAILRVHDAQRGSYGLTAGATGHLMAEHGFPGPDADVVLGRCEYLARKGLLVEVSKLIGRANRAWKISEAGLTFIDEH